MPESLSRSFASDFSHGLKAASLGSLRNTVASAKRIATSSDSVPGTVGVVAATLPTVVFFPPYFFIKGLLSHVADALEALPKSDPIAPPGTPEEPL